jgi:Tc toxin complex TcA C-terminal TcB-binding domain
MKINPKTPAESKAEVTSTAASRSVAAQRENQKTPSVSLLPPGVRFFLEARVSISAPAGNAVLTGSFIVSGVASCDLLKDMPEEPGVFVRDATNNITNVRITLGTAGPFTATPTGPAGTPWASWTFAANGVPDGPLTVKANVSANDGSSEPGGAEDSAAVIVDITPPTFIINPPADVVTPAPPFIATITGTATDNASGVAAIEWQFGGGAINTASGTANWSAQVPLPGLGSHTVALRARDKVGNVSAFRNVTVKVGDTTAPALAITAPQADEVFALIDGKVTIDLRGTASDTQAGVALVEWRLDGQTTFTAATPKAAGDWSTWSAQVPITAAGNRTITVNATDKAIPVGNVFSLQRAIVVAEPFEPKDPEAVFSSTAYLDDLLDFATHRAKTTTVGPLVSRHLLVDTYLQPFADLVTRDNRVVANQPVSQVRMCIEVLRRYLSTHARSVPAAAEAAYRQAAYVALLRQLGTSYDEIRLARVADSPARAALAGRLGIALAQFRPDRLDQLSLQPADLTEAALKTLFGLEETTLKPLAASLLPEPQLLIWQKEHLRAAWQQQDDAARSDLDTPLPVIDPDLLSTQDLRTPGPGNAAYDLWKARRDDLAAQLTALDTARKAQATQQAGFDQIVSQALGPIAELLALAAERQRGNAIDIPLRAKMLTLQPFLHLMRVRQLAVAGTVLDAEWDDVYAILIQVKKLGLYAAWRGEERLKGLILGPDFFQLPGASNAQALLLPQWRSTPQARQAWRRALEARLQQELTLKQAMQSVASAAEQEALPLLRQACVAAIAGDRDVAIIAESLTQELGIDCKDSGHQKTTRAQQALETLQEVMLSLRTGRFKTVPPVLGTANPAAQWVLALDPAKPYTEADFDEEWRWMGGYATWNAAIRVFAYPESYLLPELRPATAQTKAYKDLMTALRNQPRLTPVQARDFAAAYLLALTGELGDALPASLRKGAMVITEQLTDTQLADRRDTLIRGLFGNITDPAKAPNYVQEIFYFVPMALALQLQKAGQYLVALDWIETFYTDHLAMNERKIYRGLVLEEAIPTQYQRNPDNWLRAGLNPHEIVEVRASAYTRFTLTTLVRCYLDFADAEFTRDDGEAIARARTLYGAALALLALPEMQPPATGAGATPFPLNPVPQALKMRGELNLFKLRSGRNIAGIERQVTQATQPALTLDRLPAAGDGQRQFRPTPYRYAVLVERAKNLVSIAQQVEQAFLAALERRDAEVYNLLKAGHDLQLAGATVNLHTLQVKEAEQGIGLAERQLDRAATQRNAYQQRIDAGLNSWEKDMLNKYKDAGRFKNIVSDFDALLTTIQAMNSAASGGILGTGLGAGLGSAAIVGGVAAFRAGAVGDLNNAETAAQIDSATASFERRKEEWELQRQLSESDMAIGSQQVLLAQTHACVARQEELISRTQHDQAQATVEFLANKFTSAELYAWMSGILGGAYNYFLQQATAMAQLAQYQLAFERQESPPAFIKADYWEATDDTVQPANSQNKQPDRQGLTGSVRLLQDITRLDQFAFDTNRRKLQLTETFSLARLFPVEFQRLRETGSLPFATPMTLFDSGFPGHYLRLIKRVRMSIIALVPPVRGVRATLIASGISRVVSGGDVFQSIIVRRDPELIAFTSTSNATGLLELEPDAGMLLPFESMGVDTNWELQLPKAANPFDFRSIADVLFTVEYTALQNFSYRQQVIQQLDDRVSAERAFSLHDQFADQWYALHNPERAAAPMTVKFTLTPEGFPPNVQDLRIQQVFLAVLRAPGQTFEISNTQLRLTPLGETVAVGGAVDGTTDGLISTRRGNASAWVPLIGKSPAGAWELTLPNTEEMRNRFKNEDIEDLLLVLTYEGRTPAWPG